MRVDTIIAQLTRANAALVSRAPAGGPAEADRSRRSGRGEAGRQGPGPLAKPEGLRRTYRGLGRGRCSEASNFSCTAFSEVGRTGPIGPGAPEEGCSHRRVRAAEVPIHGVPRDGQAVSDLP